MAPLCYRRHRFPPEVIQHAIWLYLRFTLSYRDVEELLAERGLEIAFGWSESPGGNCTRWKAPPCHGARRFRPFEGGDPAAGFNPYPPSKKEPVSKPKTARSMSLYFER
jgi:hypothetical protein